MGERLADPRLGRLVEVFDPRALQHQRHARREPDVRHADRRGASTSSTSRRIPTCSRSSTEAGLTEPLLEVGLKLASTMVELFADLPPDHEYFRQFSFISADDLPDYRALVTRADPAKLDALSPADRERLIALTFKLIPARHRLGLIDEALQARVLEARRRFREQLPAELQGRGRVLRGRPLHAAASLQDNILFGKIAYGQAQAAERISDLIGEVLADLGLRERVIEVGLQAQTGVGGVAAVARPAPEAGARPRPAQATRDPDPVRCRPGRSIRPSRSSILDNLLGRVRRAHADLGAQPERLGGASSTTCWSCSKGRVVEQGRYDELARDGSALQQLVAAE